jgi:type IVB pilus formation R64 PilN family outer membrane protein
MRLKVISAAISSAMIAGCAYTPSKTAVDEKHAKMETETAQHAAQIVPVGEKRTLITHVSGNWLGVTVTPLAQEASLPAVLKSRVTLKFPGRSNLRTIAERITKVTGIPVSLKPDVFMPLSMFVGGNNQHSQNATGIPSTQAPFASSPIAPVSNTADDMELNFVDVELREVLNQINSRFGIDFAYQQDSGIVFSRLITRTLTVNANPDDNNTLAGGTQSGSGGASGQGIGGGSSTSNSSGSTGNGNVSVWTGIEKVLDTIKSPVGKFAINQASGTVTMTDTKEVIQVAKSYLDTENTIMGQQVAVRVEVLSVNSTDNKQVGVNLDSVFTKLSNLIPQWSINVLSPASLTTPSAGSVGMSIITPPKDASNAFLQKFSGSQAVFDALQGYSRNVGRQTFAAVTANRKPAPLERTRQTTYLARSVPGGNAGSGSSTLPGLEPGQVTTGFISQITPTILDNRSVVLTFKVNSTDLRALKTISTGSGATLQSIEKPDVDGFKTEQTVSLKTGATLVLTGFEREVDSYDQAGITPNIALGGSYNGNKVKESVIILITPVIVDGA